MYKNILFDFDGTISDTSVGAINAAKYALNKLDIDFSKTDLREFIGPPLQDSFKDLFGLEGNDILNAIKLFREYYKKTGLHESEMYVGINKVLKTLYGNGLNLFIASTKPTEFIKILLKKYNLQEYFQYISGSPLEGVSTPKDVVISIIIKKFKLNLNETVMIGDRKHDIIGAKENHIHSIGVEYGLGSLKELEEYSPEYIANMPSDILKIIL